jgi:hypothetical protein
MEAQITNICCSYLPKYAVNVPSLVANNDEWAIGETEMDVIRLDGPNNMKMIVYPCDLVNCFGFATLEQFAELCALLDAYPAGETRPTKIFAPGQYKIRTIAGVADCGSWYSMRKVWSSFPNAAKEGLVRVKVGNMSCSVTRFGRVFFKLSSLTGLDENSIADQIEDGLSELGHILEE